MLGLSTQTAAANLTVGPFYLPCMLQDVVVLLHWLSKKMIITSADLNYVRYSKFYHVHLLVLGYRYIDHEGMYIIAGHRHGYLFDKMQIAFWYYAIIKYLFLTF